ncbi:MAG: helix-turn-helix transcriptional regulator [Myxococcota bacterium]
MTANRFRQAREGLRLSLGQAARFSDGRVSREAIEAIEAGSREPTASEAAVLAETYRVRDDWLLGAAAPEVPMALVNARGLDRLNTADRQAVVDLIRIRR